MNRRFYTKEEIENSVFFPVDFAVKVGANKIFKIWGHLSGNEKLKQRELKELAKLGFFKKEKYTKEEILKLLKSKCPQTLKNVHEKLINYCEWCQCETLVLNDHHYPLSKKEGGKETVKICASCHYEYHYLEKCYTFTPSEEIQNLWDNACKEKQRMIDEFEEVQK